MFFSKYSVILFSYLVLNNVFIFTQARAVDIEPRDYYDGNEVNDDGAFIEEGLENEIAEEKNPDEYVEIEEEVIKDDDDDDEDDAKVEVPLVDEELNGEPDKEDDAEDEVKPYAGDPGSDDDDDVVPDEVVEDKEPEVDEKDDDDDDDDDDDKGTEDIGGDTWMDKVKKYYKNFRYYMGK